MKYTVIWGPRAEAMLADIWLTSSNRDAVTEAAARFDKQLALIPLKMGESRESSVHRVSYDPPLGVEYEVIEDDKLVVVQGVFAVP